MSTLRGLYILDDDARALTYGPREQDDIARHVQLLAPPQTRDSIGRNASLLRHTNVILSGWGAPVLDDDFLDAAPDLKAVFYGAGSVASSITPAVWDRGILLTSAIAANAVPVAEYTLATLLFSLKHGWRLSRQTRQQRTFPNRNTAPGCYGSTVGLISLGTIARTLLKLLAPFDLRVIVYDPFLTASEADLLGVERVTLSELFVRSDVVSLHTPLFSETINMITGSHLASMKPGAAFINTARGELVRQDELIDVATRRPDLQFVLDVATPEPPAADSPLYELPNILLTPHMAGSVGDECRRMGRYMVDELERFVAGKPLKWAVTPEIARHTSHRPAIRAYVRRPKRAATGATVSPATTILLPTPGAPFAH